MVRVLICACAVAALAAGCGFGPSSTRPAAPVVAITFDDAHESIYSFGYRLMREADTSWTATHFFTNDYIGGPGNVTLEQERDMERSGWESGGHGKTHDNLLSLSPDSLDRYVAASHDFLVAHGLSHESFAYTFGMYNDTVKTIAIRYFANIRTSHDFYYLDGVDRTELGYFAVKEGFTKNDIVARVEEARRLGAPLVVIGFHVIQPDTAPSLPVYWCKESVFRGFCAYLKEQHLQVMSLRDAMKILCN